jgi:hypothetical protein
MQTVSPLAEYLLVTSNSLLPIAVKTLDLSGLTARWQITVAHEAVKETLQRSEK